MDKYIPSEIESKWQKKWEEEKIYSPDLKNAKNPFYNLMMFPYPSAEGLHVGNMYAFTGADVYARFMRMKGKDVFEPIGLDGFGIHSENYALKVGRHPKEQAKISEENFYRQLHAIGNSFDWSRKVETYDPSYYKWTQWIFIQMFKNGLAYRKKAQVNWCPKDLTVLSDEQVIAGECERCGTKVEKKELEQWFFKITKYADRLLSNIEGLDWAEKVKIAQTNWIGKSEGAKLEFPLVGIPGQQDSKHKASVFTTRPDTLFGATFLVIAPETAQRWTEVGWQAPLEVKKYIKEALEKRKESPQEVEKTGVDTGIFAINPVNQEKIPVWVADYVLADYGAGAIMAVPAHDERDFEFAQKFNLPIRQVIRSLDNLATRSEEPEAYTGGGEIINSAEWDGWSTPEDMDKVLDWLEHKKLGQRETNYHLRDWLISRQRYWGPPIPMVWCEKCGWQPVAESELPVLLPDVEDWKPKGTGKSPLANIESFVKTTCPNCKGEAKRETDVSDTFLDSAWYFLRYTSTDIESEAFDIEIVKKWLPVNMYIGGAEHSVLHLLYSRFVTMVLHDLGFLDFDEPFSRFFAHGLIIKDGAKMSKSKGNVIVPDSYIQKYGADSLRTYLMFLGPFSQGGDFRDTGIDGMGRFLKRVWRLVSETSRIKNQTPSAEQETELERVANKTIKEVTQDLESLKYNTAIAHIMEYYNALSDFYSKYKILDAKYCKTLLLLLAPFAPHMTEELYQGLRNGENYQSIHLAAWPSFEEKYLEEDEVTIVVQINGKTREIMKISSGESSQEAKVKEKARELPKIKAFLGDKGIKKTIYKTGKIINFVA